MTDSKTPGKRRVGDGTPGPGRPRGKQNKMTTDLKAMILEALGHAGGAEYLYMQAFDNPRAFMSLLGRVLPLQVTGANGAPVAVSIESTPISDETLRAARVAQLLALGQQRLAKGQPKAGS